MQALKGFVGSKVKLVFRDGCTIVAKRGEFSDHFTDAELSDVNKLIDLILERRSLKEISLESEKKAYMLKSVFGKPNSRILKGVKRLLSDRLGRTPEEIADKPDLGVESVKRTLQILFDREIVVKQPDELEEEMIYRLTEERESSG